jgi:hypothetical protein
MPRYDGGGPLGRGPMTGSSEGFCIVEIPDVSEEPMEGFIGLTGRNIHGSTTIQKEDMTMPGRNRTGPQGWGPMTGRGLGSCSDAMASDTGLQGRGRGGGARGQRYRFQAMGATGCRRGNQRFAGMPWEQPRSSALGSPSSPGISGEEQLNTLKTQAEHLEVELGSVKKRIRELETSTKEQP